MRIARACIGALLLSAASAFAQTNPPQLVSPLTGQEVVYVVPLQPNGQLGAVQAQVTIGQIAAFAGASTLSTVTSGAVAAALPTTILTLPLTGAVTFTLPAAPADGTVMVLVNGSGAAFTFPVTVAATAPDTIAGAGANVGLMPARGSARYRYSTTTTSWTRIG